jgi:hypothetical protein
MMFLPTAEIKQTLSNVDRAVAEMERTAQHLQAALVTAQAILEDVRALSSVLRSKLLDGQ